MTDSAATDSAAGTDGAAGTGTGAGTAGAGAAPGRGMQPFWDAMRRTGVRRPPDDRWLGGVCAGVARRLGVDPVLLRVAVLALTLLGGVGVVAYAVALVLLPDADGRIELERAAYGDLTGTTVGAVALLLLALVVPASWDLFQGGALVDGGELVGALVVGTLLLVGLAVLPKIREASERGSATGAAAATGAGAQPAHGAWYAAGSYAAATGYPSQPTGSTRPANGPHAPYSQRPAYPAQPDSPSRPAYAPAAPAYAPAAPAYASPPGSASPPSAVRPQRRGPGAALSAAATGTALVLAGAAWLATDAGLIPGRPWLVAACVGLAVLGVTLVALGLAGRRDGSVGGAAFVAVLLTLAVLLVPSWRTTQVAGDATWQPSTAAEATAGGSLGLGEGVLDLSGLTDLPAGAGVEVPVRVGIGRLEVRVPEGMDVTVRAGTVVGSTVQQEQSAAFGGSGSAPEGGVGVERTLLRSADPQVVVDARVLIGDVELVTTDD